jgi:hypothetical protein
MLKIKSISIRNRIGKHWKKKEGEINALILPHAKLQFFETLPCGSKRHTKISALGVLGKLLAVLLVHHFRCDAFSGEQFPKGAQNHCIKKNVSLVHQAGEMESEFLATVQNEPERKFADIRRLLWMQWLPSHASFKQKHPTSTLGTE